jgi:hypothetical protein
MRLSTWPQVGLLTVNGVHLLSSFYNVDTVRIYRIKSTQSQNLKLKPEVKVRAG